MKSGKKSFTKYSESEGYNLEPIRFIDYILYLRLITHKWNKNIHGTMNNSWCSVSPFLCHVLVLGRFNINTQQSVMVLIPSFQTSLPLKFFIKEGIMAANLRKLAASKSLALLRRITNEGEAEKP